jgi:hypothetical protein
MLRPSLRLLRSLGVMMLLKSSSPVAYRHLARNLIWRSRLKSPPLSKVVVLMPDVIPIIGAEELGATFEARIASAASLLVGNYNMSEHNAYKGLWHGQLNRVFELAGVLCQPRSEPIVCK